MTRPAISQYLRVLRKVGLVGDRRVGRRRLYRPEAGPLEEVGDRVGKYERFWRDRLRALGEHLDGGGAVSRHAIVYEAVYAHPPKSAWLALTDPEALAEWLTPNDFQPRVGHRFAFRTRPQPDWDGVVECEVVELEEQKKVAYTWKGEPGIPETLVTFTLEPAAGGTRLKLVQSGFAAGEPRGVSVRDLLDSGWGSALLRTALPRFLDPAASRNRRGEA